MTERDVDRRILAAVVTGLVLFWLAVVAFGLAWLGDEGDSTSTEVGPAWAQITRCSVPMPEDLDR